MKSRVGMTVHTPSAASAPHWSDPSFSTNVASTTGAVFALNDVKTSAKMNSFHASTKQRMPAATIPFLASGRTIR